MTQVRLYLDSFLVSNFWLHFLCLRLCATTVSVKKSKRLGICQVVWSAVCSMVDLGTVLFFSKSPFYIRYTITVAELFAASFFVFGKRRVFRNAIVLFLITALFGGVFLTFRIKNTGLFCLGGSILLWVSEEIGAGIRRKTAEQKFQYEVCLEFDGESRIFTGFLDSGNRLKLYGSDTPVMVAGKCCIEDWVKKAQLVLPQRYICLPFCGVGGRGLLFGVRAECRITNEDGRIFYQGKTAVVCADLKLFAAGNCELLLQPEFFQS